MKIGIDVRLWGESGVGRYIRNLVEQLAILDCKNQYILFGDSRLVKFKVHPPAGGSKFKVVHTNIKWHSLEEQLKLPQILNKENLDLVHFPYFSAPIFYNRPFIVTIHDLIIDHFPTGQASTLFFPIYQAKLAGYKFVISQAVKKAKKIITVSNATKDEIINHFKVNEDKVVVTYEGVGKEFSNPNPPAGGQIPNKSRNTKYKILNTKYFLYVGNAYPHKNLIRMLKAFVNVKCQMSNVKLIMVGREDYFYKRLKEKVKSLNLQDSVEFKHDVDDAKLVQLYQNAKALILPSLMEGFGLSALEAMANRCLVLCSNIPSLIEICGNSALYFDPFNVQVLKEKMELVCKSGYFSKNIEEGFKRSKLFSWKKMGKETLKIYENCSLSSSE